MDNKLFVGNLAWGVTEEDLNQYFGRFGKIQQVEVMRDRFTNRARGFAFVTYETPEEAIAAVNSTEGQEFMGRPLKVNVARPREDRPPRERRDFDGPRGGGGGGGDRGGFRPRRSFNGPRGGGGGGGGYDDRPRRRFDGGGSGGGGGFRKDRGGYDNNAGGGDNGGFQDNY